MKTVLILFLTFFLVMQDKGNCSEDPKPNWNAAKVSENEGLALSLSFDKKAWDQFEPINCVVTLKNISDKEISFPRYELLKLFRFIITMPSSKKEQPLTRFGEKLLKMSDENELTITKLKPSESFTMSILQLNRIYDMTLNGKYSISVEFIGERLPKDTSKVVSKVEIISVDENNNFFKYAVFVPAKKKEEPAESKK